MPRRGQVTEKGWGLRNGAVIAVVGVVALGAGCSNKVVAQAAPPEQTTTTVAATASSVLSQIDSLRVAAGKALDNNPPTADQIAHSTIEQLRTRSLATIDKHLTSLNQASTLLNTVSHVSGTVIAALRAEIAGPVSSLTTLRATIKAEADVGAMRREASGLTAYTTVGTVIVPKVLLLGAADAVLRATDTLFQQVPGIQTRITDAANRGKPVGDPQNNLNDLKAQAGSAASQANGLIASVPSAQQADIANDQTIIANARTALNTAQGDVGKIDAALAAVGP
jgi:hypothetical protein